MSRFLSLSWLGRGLRAAATFAVLCGSGPAANAACTWCISEVYFNPPGSGDEANGDEYVELFGPEETQWSNKYLAFVENEDSASNGQVEAFFNLGSITSGVNGYIVFTMYGHSYSPIDSDATHITPNGTSSQNEGFESPYVTWSGTDYSIENSGFTALLVDIGAGSAPSIGLDMDTNNDGELNLPANWSLLDSIGVIGEVDELDSKLFSPVNFGGGTRDTAGGGTIPSGASYTNVAATVSGGGFTEIEWIGRQGTETATAGDSWIAANLKLISGGNPDDFGVAGSSTAYEAVLGRAAGEGSGTQHWSENFIVSNTTGSANHTPEPGTLALVSLAAIGVLGFRRRSQA